MRSSVLYWGHTPFCFESEGGFFSNFSAIQPDLVISGPLPARRTFRLMHVLGAACQKPPAILVSDSEEVAEFIHLNRFKDVALLGTSCEVSQIGATINRLMKRKATCSRKEDFTWMIGNSPAMVRIKKMVTKIADLAEPILIEGEPGTGKSLLANAIQRSSARSAHPFIKIDMGKILGDSAESRGRLFEIENQLRTLLEDRPSAAGVCRGTIFVDKIEKTPARLYWILLKFLGGAGGADTVSHRLSDLKCIAAHNSTGRSVGLPESIYHRFSVLKILVPPLRERREDILPLADFFIHKFCFASGIAPIELSGKMRRTLVEHDWPNNVAQLAAEIRKTVFFGDRTGLLDKIDSRGDTLFSPVGANHGKDRIPSENSNAFRHTNNLALKKINAAVCAGVEKRILKKVLDSTQWNRRKTATLLSISYKSLLNKIKMYDLS